MGKLHGERCQGLRLLESWCRLNSFGYQRFPYQTHWKSKVPCQGTDGWRKPTKRVLGHVALLWTHGILLSKCKLPWHLDCICRIGAAPLNSGHLNKGHRLSKTQIWIVYLKASFHRACPFDITVGWDHPLLESDYQYILWWMVGSCAGSLVIWIRHIPVMQIPQAMAELAAPRSIPKAPSKLVVKGGQIFLKEKLCILILMVLDWRCRVLENPASTLLMVLNRICPTTFICTSPSHPHW